MRLDWAILSNSSEIQGGLSYVLGAGWDTGWRPAFPAPFLGALTLRVMVHRTEAAERHRLVVRFWDEDGAEFAAPLEVELGPGEVPEGHPAAWEIPAQLAIALHGLPIPSPGHYSFEISVDGHHLKSVPFRFVQGQPPPVTTALPPQS
jgi:hypothetical protein